MNRLLQTALILAATGQFCIALLNLSLVRIMKWKEDLARMPLLVREVFQIHAWFISITLLIFAAMTWRFNAGMVDGGEPVYRWLAGSIGLFWAIRAILQVTYYSSSHWRGIVSRTVVHIILLTIYPGLAAVYLFAALKK